MVGDPSGKATERTLLDEATRSRNLRAIGAQLRSSMPQSLKV
jgi:tyrosyl-tRNA synthetase